MERIAFRRVLPIVQLALATGLVLLGNAQDVTVRAQAREHEAARVPRTHGGPSESKVVYWDLNSMWDGYVPPATDICIGVNLPSIVLAAPLTVGLALIFPNQVWVVFAGSAVGLVAFWTCVGFWIDRKGHSLRTPSEKLPTVEQRLWAWVGAISLAGWALFLAGAIFWGGSSHYPYTRAALVVWLGIPATLLGFKLWRWRALART